MSRFLILVPLTGRGALTVGDAVIAATGGLPRRFRVPVLARRGCLPAGRWG